MYHLGILSPVPPVRRKKRGRPGRSQKERYICQPAAVRAANRPSRLIRADRTARLARAFEKAVAEFIAKMDPRATVTHDALRLMVRLVGRGSATCGSRFRYAGCFR